VRVCLCVCVCVCLCLCLCVCVERAMASASAVPPSLVVAALATVGFALQGCRGYCSGLSGEKHAACEACVKQVDGWWAVSGHQKTYNKRKFCRDGSDFKNADARFENPFEKNPFEKKQQAAPVTQTEKSSHQPIKAKDPKPAAKQHHEQHHEVAKAETPPKMTVIHDSTAEQKEQAAPMRHTERSSHQPIEAKDPKPAALAEVQGLSVLETEEVSKPEADEKQHHEQHHEVAKAETPLKTTVSHDSTAEQKQQAAPVTQTERSSHQPIEAKDSKPAALALAKGLSALETRGVSKPASRWARQMRHINVQAAGSLTKPRN